MPKRTSSPSQVSGEVAATTRYGGLSRVSPDGRASFAGSPKDLLAAALDAVIDAGDLLSLSRTSDGGAICLYVKAGDATFKSYCATQEELGQALAILGSGD